MDPVTHPPLILNSLIQISTEEMQNILQEGNKLPVIDGEEAVSVKKMRVAEVRGTGEVESVAVEREGGSACCSELPI